MSDDNTVRIALLEQKLKEIHPLPDRVLILEQDFKSMRGDLAEVKSTLYRSIKERQTQFDSLSHAISTNHETAMSKIQGICSYNDERLDKVITPIATDVKDIYTAFKTTIVIISSIFALLSLIIAALSVYPS